MTYDALIVGTGPAGLSAALTLGRARRDTLAAIVIDQELPYAPTPTNSQSPQRNGDQP
jgi:thioredoxin reductase